MLIENEKEEKTLINVYRYTTRTFGILGYLASGRERKRNEHAEMRIMNKLGFDDEEKTFILQWLIGEKSLIAS